ncbi:DUF7315 family membrane protein [Halomarina oriensis]|uniref:DUF7315 domain-containing protein n=1 Tax=Halomarina oriensis TaxID=671145 RepID=A0A6B0GFM2_9EURY|nr:hypothetical protein [Halomarina oriensis]MWG33310.1 hypothetical protein [Halomarina oriensis]
MASEPDEPRRGTDVAEGASAADQNAWRSGDGDVVVPVELYRVVTVFSTLLAVAFVVLGFLFLDAATGAVRRVALLGWAIGLGVPIAAYLGYLSVRADAGTAERLVVLFVLFALSVALVPGAVRSLLAAAALTDGQFQVVFGVAGLVLIGVGAGVYILGTRFRTEGMGNPKDDAD